MPVETIRIRSLFQRPKTRRAKVAWPFASFSVFQSLTSIHKSRPLTSSHSFSFNTVKVSHIQPLYHFTMRSTRVVPHRIAGIVLFAAAAALAAVTPTGPYGSDVFRVGGDCTTTWTLDTTGSVLGLSAGATRRGSGAAMLCVVCFRFSGANLVCCMTLYAMQNMGQLRDRPHERWQSR